MWFNKDLHYEKQINKKNLDIPTPFVRRKTTKTTTSKGIGNISRIAILSGRGLDNAGLVRHTNDTAGRSTIRKHGVGRWSVNGADLKGR